MIKTDPTVLVTGSQGFIGGYLCAELLAQGYSVIGVDNFSKYGKVRRAHDSHPNFRLVEMNLASADAPIKLKSIIDLENVHYLVAGAAMIGGISYFHKYAYDLLATNERINANTFDAAIWGHEHRNLKRIIVISSSMVFEGADAAYERIRHFDEDTHELIWPSYEEQVKELPPPNSTYGFQKLASEYMAKGANEQYGLPYTIIRPFNCVGLGEEDALGDEEILSGNVKLMMSHVLPDLINKVLKGQDPLHILGDGSQVRCYTHGRDIARGIRMAMESESAVNEDFNISIETPTTVMELAQAIWAMHYGGTKRFHYVSDEPYTYDVQKRIPNVEKAREVLGFNAEIALDESIREVYEHMREKHERSRVD